MLKNMDMVKVKLKSCENISLFLRDAENFHLDQKFDYNDFKRELANYLCLFFGICLTLFWNVYGISKLAS